MSEERKAELYTIQRVARKEAEAVLASRGFHRVSLGRWEGSVTVKEGDNLECIVRVEVPNTFPDSLPIISVDPARLPRRIPHLSTEGVLCIAPNTGVLFDTENPRGLMNEALDRAVRVLRDGLAGLNDQAFIDEFLAYWTSDEGGLVRSICNPERPTREICLGVLSRDFPIKESMLLLSDKQSDMERWANQAGWIVSTTQPAFCIHLDTTFRPLTQQEPLQLSKLLAILKEAGHTGLRSLQAWFQRHQPQRSVTILLSVPLGSTQGRGLVAVRIERPTKETRKALQSGFRPGHVPGSLLLSRMSNTAVTRLLVQRCDPTFLLVRGEQGLMLQNQTITIVGCGAVGSRIAEHFASLGVGRLHLIDPDILMPENIHRHVLGMEHVSRHKVKALREVLTRRFPHTLIDSHVKKVQDILDNESALLLSSDLVMIALGDETLELRLNQLLHNVVRRIHAWLEPLDIGGHALAVHVPEVVGCYRCLFRTDPDLGLHNHKTFTAPGQILQRSYAGCVGTFTPFASTYADRAALEAVNLAVEVLQGEETENVLISWRGSSKTAQAAEVQLSLRGHSTKPHERTREVNQRYSSCPICGDRR